MLTAAVSSRVSADKRRTCVIDSTVTMSAVTPGIPSAMPWAMAVIAFPLPTMVLASETDKVIVPERRLTKAAPVAVDVDVDDDDVVMVSLVSVDVLELLNEDAVDTVFGVDVDVVDVAENAVEPDDDVDVEECELPVDSVLPEVKVDVEDPLDCELTDEAVLRLEVEDTEEAEVDEVVGLDLLDDVDVDETVVVFATSDTVVEEDVDDVAVKRVVLVEVEEVAVNAVLCEDVDDVLD